MKFRIYAEDQDLSSEERSSIENRVRLAVGIRTAQIDVLELVLTCASQLPSGTRCRIQLRGVDSARTWVEEEAQDGAGAVDLAIWRLNHLLDRRALRERR